MEQVAAMSHRRTPSTDTTQNRILSSRPGNRHTACRGFRQCVHPDDCAATTRSSGWLLHQCNEYSHNDLFGSSCAWISIGRPRAQRSRGKDQLQSDSGSIGGGYRAFLLF